MSAREFLAEAIMTSLRTTSLTPAAVEPMAQTLATLSGDLAIFDKAAEAQLQTIDMPTNAARSLLLEVIRNLARFSNMYACSHPNFPRKNSYAHVSRKLFFALDRHSGNW